MPRVLAILLGAAVLALLAIVYLAAQARVSQRLRQREPPTGEALRPCRQSTNCVGSDSEGAARIAPLGPFPDARAALDGLVAELTVDPGTAVAARTDRWAHLTVRSRLFGFVDDLELLARSDGTVAVRSSSRVGRSDLGANRRRVEELRRRAHGLISPSEPAGR